MLDHVSDNVEIIGSITFLYTSPVKHFLLTIEEDIGIVSLRQNTALGDTAFATNRFSPCGKRISSENLSKWIAKIITRH